MFVIYTSDQIIYTFSGNGQYVANSKKMKGQGPEDYVMVLDINLNPYLKGIDLLNPYGTIYTIVQHLSYWQRESLNRNFLWIT